MNTDIYNERVARFQFAVKNLEENILNGTKKVESLKDFQQMLFQVESLCSEFNSIYDNIENPVSQSRLLTHLEAEIDFLNLFSEMLNHLEHYHHVAQFVEHYEFESEWNDVKTILSYNNKCYRKAKNLDPSNVKDVVSNSIYVNQYANVLNEKVLLLEPSIQEAMNRIEELGNATEKKETPESVYRDENLKIIDSINQLSKDAMASIDNFYKKLDEEENYQQKETTEELKEMPSGIKLDEEYMNTLPLSLQIKYVKLVSANIEAVNGRKTTVKFNGNIKRISREKNCVASWLNCQTKLRELVEQYDKELEKEHENQKIKEEYADLYTQFKKVEARLFSLKENAKKYLNTKEVVAVASLNKEPFYVLKKSLNRFNAYFMEYKRLQKEMNNLLEKHDIGKVPVINQLEEIEETENELYEQIYFLKKQKLEMEMQDTSNLDKKIKELKSQLYKINSGRKFAIYANLKVFLKSTLLTEDINTYLQAMESPEEFVKSKEYSDKEKKKVLANIISKTKGLTEHTKKLKNDANYEFKQYGEKTKAFFAKQLIKVKRGFNLLPKKEENVLKINTVRNPIDKKKMSRDIVGAAVVCASLVGIVSLAAYHNNVLAKDKANSIDVIEETTVDVVSNSSTLEKSEVVTVNEMNNSENSIYHLNQILKEDTQKINSDQKQNLQRIKEENTKNIESFENSFTNTFEEYADFDDYFIAADGTVYQTAKDMANQENGKSTYFSEDSLRQVAGIVFEYNGEIIPVYDEATRLALINNGAEQVGVLGKNENASTNGWEGYFHDEEVQFLMDEEVNIEGRGR